MPDTRQKTALLRAADLLTDTGADTDYLVSEPWDGLLIRLFGQMPDYTDPGLDRLWHLVHDSNEDAAIAYCRERGIDVLDDDGAPVPPWRDIAVMLLSNDPAPDAAARFRDSDTSPA